MTPTAWIALLAIACIVLLALTIMGWSDAQRWRERHRQTSERLNQQIDQVVANIAILRDEHDVTVAEKDLAILDRNHAQKTSELWLRERVAHEEWIGILERKVREFQEAIGSILKERNTWRDWYHEMAHLSGNAQHMMFTEIERLSKIAKIAPSPRIGMVMGQIAEMRGARDNVPPASHKAPESLTEKPELRVGPRTEETSPEGRVA